MTPINLVYIGNSAPGSTSLQRAEALKRCGHHVSHINPYGLLGTSNPFYSKLKSPLHYRTGYRILQRDICNWLIQHEKSFRNSEIIWVDSGELLGPEAVGYLKSFAARVVLYNLDDPTGSRDWPRFSSLLSAVHLYDAVAVCRDINQKELAPLGALNTILFTRGYDEVAHAPYSNPKDIPSEFLSDVAFIGTWMRHEGRDKFMLDLVSAGVPLSIWGDRWEKSQHWNTLKQHFRGRALSGRSYVAAIQGAKISLGLLSKGNRDLSTQRSSEIPFANGLLCAQRTSEHLTMYQEDKEAVFWNDSNECAKKCLALLANDSLRQKIQASGRQRVLDLNIGNEAVCQRILDFSLQ